MILHDMNQSWTPPAGYSFAFAVAHGSYLSVVYHQTADTETQHVRNIVEIFLNDMGREVMRTEDTATWPIVKPKPDALPVGRWFRFKNGFYIALQGLQEMTRCLKK